MQHTATLLYMTVNIFRTFRRVRWSHRCQALSSWHLALLGDAVLNSRTETPGAIESTIKACVVPRIASKYTCPHMHLLPHPILLLQANPLSGTC